MLAGSNFHDTVLEAMEKMIEIVAAYHAAPELSIDFDTGHWQQTDVMEIAHCWDGTNAPTELKTTARVVWNDAEVMIGFECWYTELDIDHEYDVDQERYALWDLDVCEAFIRSPREPHAKHYREFEVAPTGQWCDLIVDRAEMKADWKWRSGMRTASRIDPMHGIWRVAMAIPFTAFDCTPRSGDLWHANLFRISRLNGERHYLTLSPTLTEIPDFHVPEKFAGLKFN